MSAARRRLAAALSAAGKEPADLEARFLLEAATGLGALALLTRGDELLGGAAKQLQNFAARRLTGEPVNRIIGTANFFGLDLVVAPKVLDPRADTEILVETALELLARKGMTKPRILDLGVGSGAILCALLDSRPDAFGVGVDLSPEACAATQINLARCGLAARGKVIRGDWAAALAGRFDLIVSNPPYISHAELGGLDREVRDHDPVLALDGGADGLAPYRLFAVELKRLLRPEGVVCLEIGWTQGAEVAALLSAAGWSGVSCRRDRAGRDRVIAVES
ncbi:release factor glutamine methyltransferase [Rhodoblastus sphagnicola]|uniref:peptide chain release factor N(5)-glutamine methyltransferase n=1 Tax=Rhodoblastus sphagnicola TaxID=333368 RepID=UPI0017E2F9C7|nr:peptide chain release factor N(5)-glutamine methyltransferase [Rhodoblastus sphagnicola]MBB4197385.1 release factor glutamine methyltransferase [Rhodoblastus sphagnicola]